MHFSRGRTSLRLLHLALLAGLGISAAQAGTWTQVFPPANTAPLDMYLLQDGSILANNKSSTTWKKITPSANGSYTSGITWTTIASPSKSRLYHSGAILKDGRFLYMGGEYVNDVVNGNTVNDNTGQIYDPKTDTWVDAPTPGWAQISDAVTVTLPNGTVMIGNIQDSSTAIFDPVTNAWTAGPSMATGKSWEETWMQMQDDSIVTNNCANHPMTEKLPWSTMQWQRTDDIPTDLVDATITEIGAGLCLYNGKAFITGSTGQTAFYTPGTLDTDNGTWTNGPVLPNSYVTADNNMTLLPSGNVFLTYNPKTVNVFGQTTSFTEFNPNTLTYTAAPNSPGGTSFGPYNGRMCLLPTGQVAYAVGDGRLYIYTPSSTAPASDSWRPVVTSVPANITPGSTFGLVGKQLCGLSQGTSYGDDENEASNLPIVRLKNTAGKVYYLRAHDALYYGIKPMAPNKVLVDVPSTVPAGNYTLESASNGIPSVGNRLPSPPATRT